MEISIVVRLSLDREIIIIRKFEVWIKVVSLYYYIVLGYIEIKRFWGNDICSCKSCSF